MLPLSICIIGKNEAENIVTCFNSLAPFLKAGAELIYTDTGSTDRTVELVRTYTDAVYSFLWCDDFSAARNFCANKAKNDWILVIDCDEYITDCDVSLLHALLKKLSPNQTGMITRVNPGAYAGNSAGSVLSEQIARLYHKKHQQYEGIIHEQIFPIDGNKPLYVSFPVKLFHPGYQDPVITREKALRNLALLKKADQSTPADPYNLFQLGQTMRILGDDKEALAYFEQALALDLNPDFDYVHTLIESYGYTLLALDKKQKALELYGVYDTFATRADFVFLMGLVCMQNAMFPEAIAEFTKATTFSDYAVEGTNSYSAYYNIGVIYECTNRTAEAMTYYQKCGSYEPAIKRLHSKL